MKNLKKISKILLYALLAIIIVLNILIIFEIDWVQKNVGFVSFDEIIFHLRVPLKGTSSDIVKDNIIKCFLPTFIISGVILFLLYKINRYKSYIYISFKKKEYKLRIKYIFLVGCLILSTVFLSIRISYIDEMFNVSSYLKARSEQSDFFEKNYVDPRNIKLEFPEEKRNLIYIYIESMESSFQDVNLDGEDINIIPKLTELAKDNINFSDTDDVGGFYNMFGTNWTASAMIAQSMGIHYNTPIQDNKYVEYNSVMASLTNIGDILKDNGYYQEIIMGSDSSFAAKNVFFEKHGKFVIKDLNSLKKEKIITKDYDVNWGFEDSILFNYAKDELKKISEKDEPFNLTLLTSNSHFPDGYVEDDCDTISDNNSYANSVYCSQQQLYDFVSWIKKQDFYENTTVILVGDHLTMASNDMLKEKYEDRRVYNAIINSATTSDTYKNRKFTAFDMFPTTLASMGVKIENNKLGLGVNLFSDKKTLLEKNDYDYVYTELSKKSDYYEKIIYNN
ncbi:MAG: LTA synthase family protein [Bacilli bacterium]|nr:LTA synthase family protein [Bacilli bacterium]